MTDPIRSDEIDTLCPLCQGHGLVSSADLESRRESESSTRMLSGVLFAGLLLVVAACGIVIGVALH